MEYSGVQSRDECLLGLQKDYAGEFKTWESLTGMKQDALMIQMKDVDWAADIYKRIFENNAARGEDPIVAVPVAGWEVKRESRWYNFILGFFCEKVRRKRELEEYAKSCSTSPIPTGIHADVILQIAPEGQYQYYFWDKDYGHCLKVSPGVRVADLDDYLEEMDLAMPHQMSTLDICSLIGMFMTGCYGPALNLGPASDKIILEYEVVAPTGEVMFLSLNDNPELFSVLKDCMLGVCFVKSVTIKGLIHKQALERRDILFKGVDKFSRAMRKTHFIAQNEHFMAMYIPVEGVANIRVTVFNPASEGEEPEEGFLPRDFWEYVNLMKTEAGEPIISAVVRTPDLHPLYDLVMKAAALDTFGVEAEERRIVPSRGLHIFETYTDADTRIKVINWLIQVNGPRDAEKLNRGLFRLTKGVIKQLKSERHYAVILNAFARYNAGLFFAKGKGGIAPLAKSQKKGGILAFEYVTYGPLFKSEGFQILVNETIEYLRAADKKFTYHPGKDLPDGVVSLAQILTDKNGKRRLKNYQKAVSQLHEGRKNIEISPILTDLKKRFIFGEEEVDVVEEVPEEAPCACSEKEKKKVKKNLKKIARQRELSFV